MRKATKIALAAGAITIAGAAGISSMVSAEYRNSHGMGMGGHGKRMHAMIERADTNKDGKITQEELDTARKNLLATHDSDKDGKLSLAEYEKLWLEIKRQRMVRGFQRIDRDGDASITLDEFLKLTSKLVSRLDSNDDGVLDDTDRRRYMRSHKGGMGMGMGGKSHGTMGKSGGTMGKSGG